MDSSLANLPFSVELKFEIKCLSFGQHEGVEIISPPSDFSELDILGAPVFRGCCFFGRNNLGQYPDENHGINIRSPWQDYQDVPIQDGIGGRVFKNDKTNYSYAGIYAEEERVAEFYAFLTEDVFEKIFLSRCSVNFHLLTSVKENLRISQEQFKDGKQHIDNIIVEGEPGRIPVTNRFTLDIGDKDFGRWWFRLRLASLDFPKLSS